MTEELEPCPFCGSNDIALNGYDPDFVYGFCCGCRATGPYAESQITEEVFFGLGKEEQYEAVLAIQSDAVCKWNQRASQKKKIVIPYDI